MWMILNDIALTKKMAETRSWMTSALEPQIIRDVFLMGKCTYRHA